MKIVATEKAPAALGPYSQGYIHGGMFYSAGQLGADPATGNLAEGIEGQADRACQNMAAVLEAAGTSFDKVVKRPPVSWQTWEIFLHLTKYMLNISLPNRPEAVWQLRHFRRTRCARSK